MRRIGLSVFDEPCMRTTTLESLSPAGPSTCTSAAGNPASRKRWAIACAAGDVLPSLYDVLMLDQLLEDRARFGLIGGEGGLRAQQRTERAARARGEANDEAWGAGEGVGTGNLVRRTAGRQGYV